MKIAFEIDIPDGDTVHHTMRDVIECAGRTLRACALFGARVPDIIRLPREFYFEAQMTCTNPKVSPDTLAQTLLKLVPEIKAIKSEVSEHQEVAAPDYRARAEAMWNGASPPPPRATRVRSWDP